MQLVLIVYETSLREMADSPGRDVLRSDFNRFGQNDWASMSRSGLAIDPRNDNKIFLALRGGGIVVSTNGCRFWYSLQSGLGSLFVNSVAIDVNNPDTMYAGTDGGASISINAGNTWNEINDGLLGATVVYSIVVDNDSNVYASTPYGVFKLEKE